MNDRNYPRLPPRGRVRRGDVHFPSRSRLPYPLTIRSVTLVHLVPSGFLDRCADQHWQDAAAPQNVCFVDRLDGSRGQK